MATVVTLLDTLPTSTNGVGEVYGQLMKMLRTTTAQQVESSLQHRGEASILTPVHPKDGGQRVARWALVAGMLPCWRGFQPRTG
jgi:hypothetical protein